jgi:hypothetical protein
MPFLRLLLGLEELGVDVVSEKKPAIVLEFGVFFFFIVEMDQIPFGILLLNSRFKKINVGPVNDVNRITNVEYVALGSEVEVRLRHRGWITFLTKVESIRFGLLQKVTP